MQKIAQYRIKNGLTQQQLADVMNVSQNEISRWEIGTRTPSAVTLLKISKILKCTIEDLI